MQANLADSSMSRVGATPGETSGCQRVALIGFGLVLAFVLLEAGLRLAGAAWLCARDRQNAVALAPGDTVRVLCIGESTTALGGEESYPRALERLLNREGGGRNFSVMNAGVPGITTDVVLGHLEQQLDRYRPHVVVTMLGVNDALVASGGVRRLPAYSSLRTVKLVQLLVQHLRAKFEKAKPERPAQHPVVARALASLASGDTARAEAILREAAATPSPPPEVVNALVVVLTGFDRFDDAHVVARQWLARHPDDAAMRDVEWQIEIARAGLAVEQRRLDDAEALLTDLDRRVPVTSNQLRAAVIGKLASVAELRGDHDGAARRRAAAETLRMGASAPSTVRNYREIARIVRGRGIALVAMQYPLRSAATLRDLLPDAEGVTFVDNEAPFRLALRQAPWDTWFTDSFAGDFGHTTPAGAELLAESAARAILALPERHGRSPGAAIAPP